MLVNCSEYLQFSFEQRIFRTQPIVVKWYEGTWCWVDHQLRYESFPRSCNRNSTRLLMNIGEYFQFAVSCRVNCYQLVSRYVTLGWSTIQVVIFCSISLRVLLLLLLVSDETFWKSVLFGRSLGKLANAGNWINSSKMSFESRNIVRIKINLWNVT